MTSKYTQEQLTAMAKSALFHEQAAPDAYAQLVLILSAHLQLSPEEVVKRIHMMADDDFSFEETV